MLFQSIVRNVHEALPAGFRLISDYGVKEETRNGAAYVLPGPMVTQYCNPEERVIFWEERDANPFFHLMECIWMMCGYNDVKTLSYYNSNIHSYSDDGETFNAAYGHRWRGHFDYDQVQGVIEKLQKDPSCRRQVIGILDAYRDPVITTKDMPCNLVVHFMRRPTGHLDMSVFNRSNDMVWGAYGANAVHFSFLHEMVAKCSGMKTGSYYQISDNFHCYDFHVEKMGRLACYVLGSTPYDTGQVQPYGIISPNISYGEWIQEAKMLWDTLPTGHKVIGLKDSFLRKVALPMAEAWQYFKEYKGHSQRYSLAKEKLKDCAASDWKRAGMEWLERRERKES